MSSKLNSGIRYAYMRPGAAWECLREKADMVLFAGNTVSTMSVRVRGVREDALYKLTFTWVHLGHMSSNHSPKGIHLSRNNEAVSCLGFEPTTVSHKFRFLSTGPLRHYEKSYV